VFRPATRFGRRQEPSRTTLESHGFGPANTPRGIVRAPSSCLRPLTPFVTHPAARRSFPIPRSCFAPESVPTRPNPPRWPRPCRSIPVRSSDVSSRTRSARPGFPGSASRAGSIEPSHLGPSERSACHTPMGGRHTPNVWLRIDPRACSRPRGLAETVPAWCNTIAHERCLPTAPSRRWSGSFSSDRVLSSGQRGSLPERDRMVRPTGACNLQYPFLKDDCSRLASLRASFPHWARGFPLLRWDIHFSGSSRSVAVCSTSSLFDSAHSGGPCLCPSVADPVIEPVSGPTRVIDLGRSRLTPRRRRQTIPVRKGFHPPSRPFTGPAPAFAVPGG
jgi:hypothetical protein